MNAKGKFSADEKDLTTYYRNCCRAMLDIVDGNQIRVLYQFMVHYIGYENLEGNEIYEKQSRAANF